MRAGLLVLLASLLAATSAWATELHYGGEVKGIYNSNLFGSASNVEDDGSFRGTPFVKFVDPNGSFHWNLEYDPSYEQYVTSTNLSGWDQDVNGAFSWSISPLVTLRASDRFDQFHSLTRFNQTVGPAGGGTAVQTVNQRNKFLQNAASLSLSMQATETQSVTLFGDHYLWNFSNNNGRDQQTMDAGLRYLKAINERLSLGSVASWSRQYFAAFGNQPSQITDYYHVGGNIEYAVDPTLQVSISAGPTLVVPPSAPTPGPEFIQQPYLVSIVNSANDFRFRDITTCPTLPDGTPFTAGGACQPFGATFAGQLLPFLALFYGKTVYFTGPSPSTGGNQLTYFANASVSKAWENWTFNLTYQRQANQAAGVGTSSIADIVYGSAHWHPTTQWDLYLNGSWVRRSQAGNSVVRVFGVAPNPDGGAPYPNAAEIDSIRSLKVSSSSQIDSWNANAYVGYRVTKRITVFGFGSWTQNTTSASYLASTTADIYTFWTGIRYEFEPIHF